MQAPPIPTDDPFGLAMLAAAAVAGLAVVWLALARVRRGSMRRPGWLLGLSLVTFLGAAAGGTAERITRAGAPETPTRPKAAIEPAPAPRAPTPTPRAEDDAGHATTEASSPTGGEDGEDDEPVTGEALLSDMLEAAAEGDYLRVGQRYRVLSTLDPPPPGLAEAWKKVAPARTKVVRQWIADAAAIARGRCDDPDAIAGAFAKLRSVAEAEPTFSAAKRTVQRLESCRQKLVRATRLSTKRARMEARRRFAEQLERTVRAKAPRARVTTGGRGTDARIRIAPVPPELAASLVEDGLLERAEALGFGHVTFSDGKTRKTHDLEPRADAAVADDKLQQWGLKAPLSLAP